MVKRFTNAAGQISEGNAEISKGTSHLAMDFCGNESS